MSFVLTVIQQIRKNWAWLRWPVALLLLGSLFYLHRDELQKLAARPINWKSLAFAFVLCGASITLTFYRWYLLVWAQNFPFTVRDALRLGFIGYAFNYVAPGSAGGDLVKAAMIATEQKSRKGVAAATVLLDRILGLLALFLVGALACFFQPVQLLEQPVVQKYVVVLWVGSIGGVVGLAIALHPAFVRSRMFERLVRLPKIGHIVDELVNAVLLYQSRSRVLIFAVLISIAGHFGMLSSFYICSRAISAGEAAPGYWAHLLLIPGAEVGAVFVPVPGGVGALEWMVETCYRIANEASGLPVEPDVAIAAGLATALAYRAITIVIAAVGAGYYLTARGDIGRALSDQGPPSTMSNAVPPIAE